MQCSIKIAKELESLHEQMDSVIAKQNRTLNQAMGEIILPSSAFLQDPSELLDFNGARKVEYANILDLKNMID